ncbi:MAG: T9SS type A sorting domain-containing protein [Candidatus Zixiibacteriota bacterium]|jgi:hypothetical protein
MKRALYVTVLALVFAAAVWPAVSRRQTNWVGGPGTQGPVSTWGNLFWDSTKVNYSNTGYLVLGLAPDFPGTRHHVGSRNELYAAQTGDINGDGRPDIVVGGHNSGIVWYENLGGGTFATSPTVILDYTWPSFHVYDLNDDGLADVIYTNDQYIYWLENVRFGWSQHRISNYFNEVDGTGCADFDDDGDVDIVAGGVQVTQLRWYENDGNQNFTEHVIRSGYRGPNNAPLGTGDLNGDGLPDFVISSEFGNFLEWWENDGGSTPTFTAHRLLNNYNGSRNSFVVDVDGDGHNDILSAAIGSDSIDWWENNGAATPTFTRHNISNNYNGAYDISGFDADQDGDIDIMTTAQLGDTLDWWQNDGAENFTRGTIASGYNGASSIWVEDVDANGVLDIVSSALDAGSADWWDITYGYRSSGELVSSILDTGGSPAYGHIFWGSNLPSGTEIRLQVRASNNSGNMGNWSSDITTTGADLKDYIQSGRRYFQYKARLFTTNAARTPRLNQVRITYSTSTGVVLDFDAYGRRDGVALKWHTDGAPDVAGFNLYRAAADTDKGRLQLNDTLIAGKPPYEYVDPASAGTTFRYWLEMVTLDGGRFEYGPVVGTAGASRAKAFALAPAYPNPARGEATFAFSLAEAGDVRVEVYDLTGRRIATPAAGPYAAGEYEVAWDIGATSAVPPGVYVYRLTQGDNVAARKFVITE